MSLEYRQFLSTFILAMVNIWSLFNRFRLSSPCFLCDADAPPREGLCAACKASLPILGASCSQCGIGLSDSASVKLCGHCQTKPPPVDHTVAAFHYEPPLDFLLQSLKFREQLGVARLMAHVLGEKIANEQVKLPDCIIPVPLHEERLKERGYNQALEIARPLAKRFNLDIDYQRCQRVKATGAQSALSAKARVDNIRGAFGFTGQAPWQHVAIVDDVMTTGNTLWEMAHCLKRAGVARVDAWVCARAF